MSRVPELRENLQAEDAIPDASEASELELLTGRIPRLVGILPDVLRDKPGTGERCKAALSHILSKLLDCLDPTRPVSGFPYPFLSTIIKLLALYYILDQGGYRARSRGRGSTAAAYQLVCLRQFPEDNCNYVVIFVWLISR